MDHRTPLFYVTILTTLFIKGLIDNVRTAGLLVAMTLTGVCLAQSRGGEDVTEETPMTEMETPTTGQLNETAATEEPGDGMSPETGTATVTATAAQNQGGGGHGDPGGNEDSTTTTTASGSQGGNQTQGANVNNSTSGSQASAGSTAAATEAPAGDATTARRDEPAGTEPTTRSRDVGTGSTTTSSRTSSASTTRPTGSTTPRQPVSIYNTTCLSFTLARDVHRSGQENGPRCGLLEEPIIAVTLGRHGRVFMIITHQNVN